MKNISMWKKMLLLCVGLSLLGSVASGIGYQSIREISSQFSVVVDGDTTFAIHALKLGNLNLNLRRYEKDYLLNVGEPKLQDEYLGKLRQAGEMIRAEVRELNSVMKIDKSLQDDKEIRKAIDAILPNLSSYLEGVEQVSSRMKSDQSITPQQGNNLISMFKESSYNLAGSLERLEKSASAVLARKKQDALLTSSQATTSMLSVMGVAFSLSTIIGLLLARSVIGPLRFIAASAERIAGGDLENDLSMNRRDEIGHLADSLRTMTGSLKARIAEADEKSRLAREESEKAAAAMREAEKAKLQAESARAEGMLQAATRLESIVEAVSGASEELSVQVEQSSQGARDLSQRAAETATAMEEMNATVLEVAKSASQAAEIAQAARENAQSGEKVVGEVVRGVGQAQEQAQALKAEMAALGEQARAIGRVLNVITDIADQTNLLALNAAIEAARAGDAGRGFAVVADEVRKLAEKTMTATKEVGDAITGIQSGARDNAQSVDRTVQVIEQATALARQSGDSLAQIVSLVDATSDQVRSIATASGQQSAASDEISRSVEDVSAVSTQTAQAMNQASSAIADIARQSGMLNALIQELKAA